MDEEERLALKSSAENLVKAHMYSLLGDLNLLFTDTDAFNRVVHLRGHFNGKIAQVIKAHYGL